ncbi:protein odr-4 homolog [Capsicum annuum]|uniref:protein odr-4 homolog n=1 Tax=Capsicum annuum TaxID=4072 RepID=UPI001FB0B87A|nr:protein odr-4 homolog [Capsicum annuum]
MVKTVVGEETQLKLTENRLSKSGVPCQVGLVIGDLSLKLDRGFIYDLIPTPPNEEGEPACSIIGKDERKRPSSKGGKPHNNDSALFIDKDWVAEHARQVGRMLLGGMKVVGIYVWTSESSFKNSTITLCQAAKSVAEAAPLLEVDWDERLLVHIGYSPLRWTCRNCSLGSNITSGNLRPCDLKMGRILSARQAFRCTYDFDLRLPICRGSSSKRLVDILHHGISGHAEELKGAKALIDGKLANEDEQFELGVVHDVEFLLPFNEDKYLEVCSQKEVTGLLVFSGCICSYAYSNSKEPASQALTDIKEDIIKSLRSRLDMMCDEADRKSDSKQDRSEENNNQILSGNAALQLDLQLQSKHCSLSFPRRVFLPWLADTFLCDYVQPSESVEVVKDHFAELVFIEFPNDSSKILEPEAEARALLSTTTKSFRKVSTPYSLLPKSDDSLSKQNRTATIFGSDEKSTKPAGFNLMMSVLVLVVSIVVGVVVFVVRSS